MRFLLFRRLSQPSRPHSAWPYPHAVASRYTQFISAHAQLADPVAALGLLREMKQTVGVGHESMVLAFTAAMEACLNAGNPDLALAIGAELRKSHKPDEVCHAQPLSSCHSMCIQTGSLSQVAYVMVVRAYGMKREVRKAALLVASLQREHRAALAANAEAPATVVVPPPPSSALYNALLRESVASSSWALAEGALAEVLLVGRPNDATEAPTPK